MQTITHWQVFFVMAVTLLLVSWVKQNSLSDYWQQSHQNSQVWDSLATYPIWQTGTRLTMDADGVMDGLHVINKNTNQALNNHFYAQTLYRRKQAEIAAKEAQIKAQLEKIANQQAIIEKNKELTTVTLGKWQKVFFVGDSLMQGVAPWVMKSLQNTYGIDSINLSKQSTGLSYNTFFDWPATVEDTLKQDKSIGLMVVFLGPNDPWDVPDPDTKKLVVFDSPRWHEIYHAKMARLLVAAKENNVQVLWVLPPNNRKKPKLYSDMQALRGVIASGVDKKQVLLINAQSLLGDNEQDYFDSRLIDGKPVKLRTADGIHFTTEGQKIIANAIVDKIKVQ